MNTLTSLLRPHVAELETDARNGDEKAVSVIRWYENYRRCPENGALVVCEEMFKEWKKAKKAST